MELIFRGGSSPPWCTINSAICQPGNRATEKLKTYNLANITFFHIVIFLVTSQGLRGVAQFGSASGLGTRGSQVQILSPRPTKWANASSLLYVDHNGTFASRG